MRSAPTAARSAKVAVPGSRIAAATRSTNIEATVTPGMRPITVPSRKSRQRMCDAPATIFTTENGPTGTTRAKTDREQAALAQAPRQVVQPVSREPADGLPAQVPADGERSCAAQGGADQRVDAAQQGTEDRGGDAHQHHDREEHQPPAHKGQDNEERRERILAQRVAGSIRLAGSSHAESGV